MTAFFVTAVIALKLMFPSDIETVKTEWDLNATQQFTGHLNTGLPPAYRMVK